MGQSIETQVRFVSIDRSSLRAPELTYMHHGYSEESPLSKSAYKALRDAEVGDLIEVVWDFDIEQVGYFYPIVKARRITGSIESRVERLEKALRAAGIDIPEEAE